MWECGLSILLDRKLKLGRAFWFPSLCIAGHGACDPAGVRQCLVNERKSRVWLVHSGGEEAERTPVQPWAPEGECGKPLQEACKSAKRATCSLAWPQSRCLVQDGNSIIDFFFFSDRESTGF